MATYINGPKVAFAFEQVTVDSTGGGFGLTGTTIDTFDSTTKEHRKASEAQLSVETAQIRYTVDGTAPTTTVGHIANDGDILVITGQQNLTKFKAIRTGATSATLTVTYYE